MRFSRTAAAFVLAGMVASSAMGGVHPGVELGLMISPGYSSYMEDVYGDISGGYGWFNVGGNLKIDVNDHFAIVPAVDAYLNFIDYGYDTDVNSMVVPALNLRYSFKKEGSFFVEAGPNLSIANGGGNKSEFDGGGIGGGGMVGYSFKPGVEVVLGYNYISVDAASRLSAWSGEAENFGGPFLRCGYKF